MDCSTPGFPVPHQLPEFTQTRVHWVDDAVQPSHPLSSPSPPAFNLSQRQGLFQWITSSHRVAKVLELQLQYQSFQWIFRVNIYCNYSQYTNIQVWAVQFSLVTQSCLTLCNPMDCSMLGFPVHQHLPELAQTPVVKLVMPSNHIILCHPLFLLPSIFPSVRVFFNESVLPIRWPEYWSFSFSISPSNKYSGRISFRMDWLDLLGV